MEFCESKSPSGLWRRKVWSWKTKSAKHSFSCKRKCFLFLTKMKAGSLVSHFPTRLHNLCLETKQNWPIGDLWQFPLSRRLLVCLHHCHGSGGTVYSSNYLSTSWPAIGYKGRSDSKWQGKLLSTQDLWGHVIFFPVLVCLAYCHLKPRRRSLAESQLTFVKLLLSKGLQGIVKLSLALFISR